jgi:hypothetical protein
MGPEQLAYRRGEMHPNFPVPSTIVRSRFGEAHLYFRNHLRSQPLTETLDQSPHFTSRPGAKVVYVRQPAVIPNGPCEICGVRTVLYDEVNDEYGGTILIRYRCHEHRQQDPEDG